MTFVGAAAFAFDSSPLARSRFAEDWIHGDISRRGSRTLSLVVLIGGHLALVVAAVWWLASR